MSFYVITLQRTFCAEVLADAAHVKFLLHLKIYPKWIALWIYITVEGAATLQILRVLIPVNTEV